MSFSAISCAYRSLMHTSLGLCMQNPNAHTSVFGQWVAGCPRKETQCALPKQATVGCERFFYIGVLCVVTLGPPGIKNQVECKITAPPAPPQIQDYASSPTRNVSMKKRGDYRRCRWHQNAMMPALKSNNVGFQKDPSGHEGCGYKRIKKTGKKKATS